MTENNVSITRGRPIPFVDAFGNVVSGVSKVILLCPQFENHSIGPEVEEIARAFIVRYQLYDVKVRLNEYAPMDELGRTLTNKRMNIFLRLTLGLLVWLAYVLRVGRLTGGDHYNPYANTISLYSDHEGIAAHELGHALDFRRQKYPGLYAVARLVPLVPLVQEYHASRFALGFFKERGEARAEVRSYRILVPAYATYLVGGMMELIPSPVVVLATFPFIVIGHVVGRIWAALRHSALGGVRGTGFSLGSLTAEDMSAIAVMLSPRTQKGRDFWGVLLGFLVGMMISPGWAIVTAMVGMLIARVGPFGGSTPPRALPPARD